MARAAKYVEADEDSLFLTYGDGVANADIRALAETHWNTNCAITVTAVHPAGRFGEMKIGENGLVRGFHEKPQTEAGLINGGFMVVRRRFIERYLSNDSSLVLEQEPMRNAAKDGEMGSYQHTGFWQCMDTAREKHPLTYKFNRKLLRVFPAKSFLSRMPMRKLNGIGSPVVPEDVLAELRTEFKDSWANTLYAIKKSQREILGIN